jgi:photosystem II P680 reaction center D1 protein
MVAWICVANIIPVATRADVINRVNLGMEVMHERNAHNVPLSVPCSDAFYCGLLSHPW